MLSSILSSLHIQSVAPSTSSPKWVSVQNSSESMDTLNSSTRTMELTPTQQMHIEKILQNTEKIFSTTPPVEDKQNRRDRQREDKKLLRTKRSKGESKYEKAMTKCAKKKDPLCAKMMVKASHGRNSEKAKEYLKAHAPELSEQVKQDQKKSTELQKELHKYIPKPTKPPPGPCESILFDDVDDNHKPLDECVRATIKWNSAEKSSCKWDNLCPEDLKVEYNGKSIILKKGDEPTPCFESGIYMQPQVNGPDLPRIKFAPPECGSQKEYFSKLSKAGN